MLGWVWMEIASEQVHRHTELIVTPMGEGRTSLDHIVLGWLGGNVLGCRKGLENEAPENAGEGA